MSKKVNITIITALLGVVILLGLWEFLDTEKVDMLKTRAEMEMTAQELLSVLKDGGQGPKDSLKIEQIVEVSGLVKETNLINGRITVLLKGNEDGPSYIICDMMPQQRKVVSRLKPNDSVKIKGMYKGYLKDAVLLDCIVIFSQAND